MIYTPNSIVYILSKEGITMRPKKVRRIMRKLYPDKNSKMWELNQDEFNRCLEEVRSQVRDKERGTK